MEILDKRNASIIVTFNKRTYNKRQDKITKIKIMQKQLVKKNVLLYYHMFHLTTNIRKQANNSFHHQDVNIS